jgi:prepilin-type N-terminal cleavage/methylation domain-containing protein
MKENKGLGLIEVLIAIAILTIGVVAVIRVFPAAIRQQRVAAQRTVAAELARSEFAKLRSSSSEFLARQGLYNMSMAGGSYSGMYTNYAASLTRMKGAAASYLQRASFTVLTSEGRTEEFVTYITKQ